MEMEKFVFVSDKTHPLFLFVFTSELCRVPEEVRGGPGVREGPQINGPCGLLSAPGLGARERGDSRRVRGVGKRRGRGESRLWPLWPPFLRPHNKEGLGSATSKRHSRFSSLVQTLGR